MKISIIIPTLNEERYLPKLLRSLQVQTFRDFEIIVADASSTDRTVLIARSYNAKVVDGGLPAVGRNAGAAAAEGDFLFFFDADVVLPPDFLGTAYDEIQERYSDLATCEFRPISDITLDKVIHHFINWFIRTTARVDPKAFGFAIFVSRRLFELSGGFDGSIIFGEDAEFMKRVSQLHPMIFLKDPILDVSVRRFKKEGRFAYAGKGIKLNLYRAFKGEIREEVIEYEFGHYDEKRDLEKKKFLERIEERLIALDIALKRPHNRRRGQ